MEQKQNKIVCRNLKMWNILRVIGFDFKPAARSVQAQTWFSLISLFDLIINNWYWNLIKEKSYCFIDRSTY